MVSAKLKQSVSNGCDKFVSLKMGTFLMDGMSLSCSDSERFGMLGRACFTQNRGLAELEMELALRVGFCDLKKVFIFFKKNYHFSQ